MTSNERAEKRFQRNVEYLKKKGCVGPDGKIICDRSDFRQPSRKRALITLGVLFVIALVVTVIREGLPF